MNLYFYLTVETEPIVDSDIILLQTTNMQVKKRTSSRHARAHAKKLKTTGKAISVF